MTSIQPSRATACPVCDSQDLTPCIRIPGVPVYCNVLHETREAALRAARGDIDLVFCRSCGHLFNAAFDPHCVTYSGEYENSLHYSGRFQEYAHSLAERLVELHGLHGKTIIEIACGQGDFLELLCSLGGNKGIGFDPSHVRGRSGASNETDLTFVRDYYSEAYAGHKADLICCRHALEHIDRPGGFLRMVRSSIGDGATAVFFEVPNALFTLKDLGIWDIIYEHCDYYCEQSLTAVFRRNGFNVDRIESVFGGQFLILHGSPAVSESAGHFGCPTDLEGFVGRFGNVYRTKVESWKKILWGLHGEGRKAVLWGAGSKGVSFLNSLGVTDEIGYLIDLNPYKHGRFVPGTGHEVKPPAFLADYRPDAVVVMNPLYANEIRRDLQAMDLEPEILVDHSQ